MNYVIVLASGIGARLGQSIPKQFINIYDKPVIVYTLEGMEHHPDVDKIEVVCLDGWQEMLKSYAEQFGINKLVKIVTGGDTVQESIRNGVEGLAELCDDDDIVLIHDGIRPLVDESVLTDVIMTCKEYGNAVTALPYNEQIFIVDDEKSTTSYIPRETIMRVATPQAYRYSKLRWAYERAFNESVGLIGSAYTNTLMVDLGERLFFAKGSDKNIKITTQDDLELFKGYLNAGKISWTK